MATHELVLEQIQVAINLGRFQPGDRLPAERELAAMLHVSRTTIREAITLLEKEGIVAVRRGRGGGIVVREPVRSRAEIKKLLRANRDQIRDVFDYRVAVESASARLAAQRRSQSDIDTMRRLVEAMAAIIADRVRVTGPATFTMFHNFDSQFHLAIARAAGSPRLAKAVLESRSDMFLPVGAVFADLDPGSNDMHMAVVEAIIAADGDAAARHVTDHINQTRAYLDALL
jgi:DNA-binding FadR family transcriptional regulator